MLDKETLERDYVVEGLTYQQIAEKYKLTAGRVGQLTRQYGIKARTASDMQFIITKQELENLYLKQNKTYKEIADIYGKSVQVVQNNIKLHNIKPRPQGAMTGKACSPAKAAKISAANKGKPKSEQHRKKLSEARLGAKNPNFGKPSPHPPRIWHQCPNGQWVAMRSNWEVAYAEYLTVNGIKWEYEPKTFILADGRAYTPDFKIQEDEYVEVKGWFRDEHRSKMNQFAKDYPKIKLVLADRKYLIGLGIDLMKKWISMKPQFPCEQCSCLYYRVYPSQRFCCHKCRNKYIANNRCKSI